MTAPCSTTRGSCGRGEVKSTRRDCAGDLRFMWETGLLGTAGSAANKERTAFWFARAVANGYKE